MSLKRRVGELMRKRKFSFTIIRMHSFCLVLLFSITFLANHLTGQTQLAGEAKFPRHDHDEWKFDQYNPDLEASIKIISTINTYFRILYKSLINGTLYDFGFLFDQTSPEAIEDYAYERTALGMVNKMERLRCSTGSFRL